ncbi:MAG: hypothetical protein IJR99_08425 [Kiritimatiellae bacterium]|nr:hypothetical protein [Kiritimatiellia bacterium]
MTLETICSGLAGALLAIVLSELFTWWQRRREFRALLVCILAVCDYDLSIVDEVTRGSVNHNGSFKRLSVEHFRALQMEIIKYSNDYHLQRNVSRLCIDMELFNRRAEYIFDQNTKNGVAGGAEGMLAANEGIKDSIDVMKGYLYETYGLEEPDE